MCNLIRIQNEARVVEFTHGFIDDDVSDSTQDSTATDAATPERVSPWDNVLLRVVCRHENGATVDFMRWGVWPFYEKKRPKNFASTCNARDDSLMTKRLWRRGVERGRCLVPVDGFAEWTGPKGAMWRVMFTQRDDAPFFVAAVWDRDPDNVSRGFALVTTRPNPLIAALPHDRMPVILDHDAALAWLGREPLPPEEVLALCRPYPGDLIRIDDPRPEPKAGKITRADLESLTGELPF